MFDYLTQQPSRAARFAGAMSFRTTNPGDRMFISELVLVLLIEYSKEHHVSLGSNEDEYPFYYPYSKRSIAQMRL